MTRTASAQEATEHRRGVRLRDLGIRHLWPLWVGVALLVGDAVRSLPPGKFGIDAHAYWLTGQHSVLYWRPPGGIDAYLYSPAFAQIIHPFTLLPWPVFYGLWITGETIAFAWLLKPLGWAWGVPALMLCGYEITPGNITGFVAVAPILGLSRWPEAWTFVILTKPTLALGLPWAVARRDWRALRRLTVASIVVIGLSTALWPEGFVAWTSFLLHHRDADPTLPYRVAAAWLLCGLAARHGRTWAVVPLMVLASPPTLAIGEYVTLFAAIPRLRGMRAAR